MQSRTRTVLFLALRLQWTAALIIHDGDMGCLPSKSRVRALVTRARETEDERRRTQYAFDLEEADLSDNDYLSTKPKSSVTITVRQAGPSVAQKCLDEILPAADDQTAKRGKPIGPVGWGIWKTKKERQTFIR